MPLLRTCSVCGRTYDPYAGGYHRAGKCQACTRDYERARSRAKPQRLARGSARFKKLREFVKARDGHRCQQCGSGLQLEVHHIVALASGGAPFDPANLVTLCRSCHDSVAADCANTTSVAHQAPFVARDTSE
jgi:5-methylcytosine-specific restriction endonuclease McrA